MIQGNLGRGALRARKNETTHVFNIMSGHGTPNGTAYHRQIKFKKLEKNFFLTLPVLCFYLYVNSLYEAPKVRVPSPNYFM